jgi:hypothetical protein
MAGRITPIKQCYGANLDADAVSGAYVPVNSHGGSMDAQLLGRFNRSPDIVPVVLTCDLSILLKIGIYWQTDSPTIELKPRNINSSVSDATN